ncbi:MAG: methylmalonyl Co-A mutase-associated GTPase MeaB [Thermodesulfobacteriota bacterium]|nr:methylmalonyl Co-A mutase-associated GTPase MeaB [Thermodesulfobacteriota bacterium]
MRNDEKTLIKGMLSGNRVSLSKLISLVESDASAISRIIETTKGVPNKVCAIGITGPPGAGKSTVTNRIIKIFRDKGLKIGIIAVDPSSPFTGGAVLGDRIRMQDHALDNQVFIRSIGSRGDLGGLSNAASGIVKLFDIFGMDIVIIETVGVGQTELDIIKISDCVLVTLVPEAGDGVQAMKAGLMEIGDVFVVNKSDRGGAEKLAREIDYMISLKQSSSDWKTKVLTAQAENNIGMEEIVNEIESFIEFETANGNLTKKKNERQISEIDNILDRKIKSELKKIKNVKEVKKLMDRLKKGTLEPEEVAELIFDLLKKDN